LNETQNVKRLKRRTVLKQLGLGVSAGLAFPHLLSSCAKDGGGPEVEYDGTVAIVGAGAAGLFAADILRSKGINVIIYEAGDQVGGRIRSLRNQKDLVNLSVADFPVELGAELIFGSDSKWATEAKNLSIPLIDVSDNSVDRFILENIVKTADEWSGDVEFSGSQNFVNDLANLSGGGSIEQAIAGFSDRAKQLLSSQVGNFYGTSNARLGATGIAECLSLREHDKKILTIGTNPMQDFLISRFSLVNNLVQLNTPITSINYDDEIIELTDANGNTSEAGKVIVTIPVSILKTNGISFSPALPASFSSSLAKIGMDHSIRVLIDFKKNFWGEDAGFLWGLENAPYCFSTGVGRSEFFQTMSITVNGPKAEELSGLGADMINVILSELDLVYDGQASQFVRRDLNNNQVISIVQDWGKEEFIKGGFSYPMVSATMDDRKNIGQAVDGKIFFAGEATDIAGDAGTINGALASAERATNELVESILSI
jgi:hypothetical protein